MRSKQPIVLHSSMTGVEKSNAWNQHQNHLKNPENESLKKEFDSLDKKGKGLATSLFLLKKTRLSLAMSPELCPKKTA